jgi:hypothetical protein
LLAVVAIFALIACNSSEEPNNPSAGDSGATIDAVVESDATVEQTLGSDSAQGPFPFDAAAPEVGQPDSNLPAVDATADTSVGIGIGDGAPEASQPDSSLPAVDATADTSVGIGIGDGAPEAGPLDSGYPTVDADADGSDGSSSIGVIADPEPCGALAPGSSPSASQLLDLGHQAAIALVRQAGSFVLTRDGLFRWILWNTTDRSRVLEGVSPSVVDRMHSQIGYLDMRGTTLAVESSFGSYDMRSVATGSLLGTIATAATSFGLASDGSYFWAATGTKLQAWSLNGTLVLDRDGAYASAIIYAAPGELRIGNGPAGASVVENVAIPSGSATTTPTFSGSFHSWFLDGASFLTTLGTTVWVYPKSASAAKGIFALSTTQRLAGQADFFWTYEAGIGGSPLTIYSVAGGSTPIRTIGVGVGSVFADGNMIAIIPLGEP